MGKYKPIIFLLHVVLIFCFASSAWSEDHKSASSNSADVEHSPAAPNNVFTQIQIRPIKSNGSSTSTQCHASGVDQSDWQHISFSELPQNQFFCLRAKVNIHRGSLSSTPSLLVGMLGSTDFRWDNKPLISNGSPARSYIDENPGTIKTLVRLPDDLLNDGEHVLSATISTFSVGKELDSIGYVLAIVDERKLANIVLFVSMLSAFFIGVLVILFVIFQLVNWLYQAEKPYQIFSILCLSAALLLSVEQAKFWLDYPYNWHALRLSVILVLTFITSFLLPMFYVAYFRLKQIKIWAACSLISLTIISLLNLSYDITSVALFFAALCWSLIINVLQIRQCGRGKAVSVLIIIGIGFIIFYPEYFVEFGFAVFFIAIVLTMLVALIREMRQHKERSLKAERIKTELLRRNMQPHFLMNCLTQLMELIETKPQDALVLISALSQEFRQLTQHSKQDYVPLSEEIALCKNHIQIMSIRYQKDYQLAVVGEVEGIWVPSAILHSLLENCFTHNKISSDRTFELKVTQAGRRVNLTLITPIENNTNHQGTGSGNEFIHAKLAELNQKEAEFTSYESGDNWISQISYFNINATAN
jgi:sensor histidine kinase YesM